MELIEDILDGALVSFVINVGFCFLCRPEIEGMRYMGGYVNPVMFARYLVCIGVIVLYRIDKKLKMNAKLYAYLPELVLGSIALAMEWKTQSVSGIYPFVFLFIFFVIQQIRERRSPRKVFALLAMAVVMNPAS